MLEFQLIKNNVPSGFFEKLRSSFHLFNIFRKQSELLSANFPQTNIFCLEKLLPLNTMLNPVTSDLADYSPAKQNVKENVSNITDMYALSVFTPGVDIRLERSHHK